LRRLATSRASKIEELHDLCLDRAAMIVFKKKKRKVELLSQQAPSDERQINSIEVIKLALHNIFQVLVRQKYLQLYVSLS
jgi:hypothetical protein